LAAAEGGGVALPVGDFAAGFFDQKQSGGDVPGVDETVEIQAVLQADIDRADPVSRLSQGKLTSALLPFSFSEHPRLCRPI